MGKTSIEWTDVSWNPTTGCTKISDGCKNCYAEKLSFRLKAMGNKKYINGFDVTLHPSALNEPFNWRKPRMVFVNSMSDLFHENIDNDFIIKVFEVMNNTPQHIYQILTKRTKRLLSLKDMVIWTENIWIGTTVEHQKYQERIDDIILVPAKVRFLSCEPLLSTMKNANLEGINWVIVGGESGTDSRVINESWVLEIKNLCEIYSIPFFFKQWGSKKSNPNPNDPTISSTNQFHAKGGCELNGKVYHEFPEVSFIL
jgi:protein gp37